MAPTQRHLRTPLAPPAHPLSIMLGQAARKGRIPVNPISQLERGERPCHDDQRPKRILALEEMQALLAAVDGEQYRCLVELLLTGGLRIGEALGLTVADLDAKHAIVKVEYQLGRDGTRTPLKTEESRRAVDIPAPLMRKLLDLVEGRGQLFNPQAFVFASRNETGLERKPVRAALRRGAKRANLLEPLPSLHDLRHSHASMLIAMNLNVVEVQHRLGHRKPDTTLKVYTHEWKYRRAQRSRIGEHIHHLFTDAGQPALEPPPPRRLLALPAPADSDVAADADAQMSRQRQRERAAGTVGERIRARRLELGLSQRELADEGVSYAYISRLETNDRTPSVRALRRLAPKLGVSVHWLESGEPDPAEQLARLVLARRGRALPAQATRLARAVLRERQRPSG